MSSEVLKIFDKNRQHIGEATREEVHRLGHWHEAIHCWFVRELDGVDYIYLQLRSKLKMECPNLYDITAAGHLLVNETVEDGVREIEEELGVCVSYNELTPLGILNYNIESNGYIDREFVHVYLYHNGYDLEEFILQKEEVSGIVMTPFKEFYQLWIGEINEIQIDGYEIDGEMKIPISKMIGRGEFAAHDIPFYREVVSLIKKNI